MLDKPHTPAATVARAGNRAREIARGNGVRHVYTGNVHDATGGSTWCHGCGELLIGRDWYVLGEWNLTPGGRCTGCGAPCAGVFDGPKGDSGARRQPVRLADFAV